MSWIRPSRRCRRRMQLGDDERGDGREEAAHKRRDDEPERIGASGGGETTEVAGSTPPVAVDGGSTGEAVDRRQRGRRDDGGRRIHPSRRRRQRIRARGASGGGVQAEEPRIHLNVRVQIARVEACRLQRAHEVSHLLAGVTVPRNKTTTSQNPSRRVISSGDMAKYPIHRPPATRRWLHG